MADTEHAAVHRPHVQLPAVQAAKFLGTLVAGQILEGTAMLLEAGLTGIDLATGLAGQIVVHVLQVHPQRHFRVAAATALAADGGVLAFFDGFLAKGKPVQHFLRQ